jgi:hypothetical protein
MKKALLWVLSAATVLQILAVWLRLDPDAIQFEVGRPIPLVIDAVDDPAGFPHCTAYVLCTPSCVYCARLADEMRQSGRADSLNWLILGKADDAKVFATSHAIRLDRVSAVRFPRTVSTLLGFRYYFIPGTPLHIQVTVDGTVAHLGQELEDASPQTPACARGTI